MTGDVALACLHSHPIFEGHTLVVPQRHVSSIYDLPTQDQDRFWRFVSEVRKELASRYSVESFNIGLNDGSAAGQAVPHAHVHIIPRRPGDVPDPSSGSALYMADAGTLFAKAYEYHTTDPWTALHWYDKATNLDPGMYKAWFNKGSMYEAVLEWDKAIECYLKVADIQPSNVAAARHLGLIYFRSGQFSKARYWLEKVIRFGQGEVVLTNPSGASMKVDLVDMHRTAIAQSRRPHSIFVSYPWAEQSELQMTLVEFLRRAGYDVFIDVDRIPQQGSLPELPWQIEQGIAQCDALILLWSAASSRSSWVRAEVSAAIGMIKSVVPVLCDDSPLPPTIEAAIRSGRIVPVHVRSSTDYQEIVRVLKRQIDISQRTVAENERRRTEITTHNGVAFEWIRLHGGMIPDFAVGKYPVTQGQWRAVIGTSPAHYSGDEALPVENVSWKDVQRFLAALNKTTGAKVRVALLTDIEWEFACRAGSLGNWAFGDNEDLLPEFAWFCDNTGWAGAPGRVIRTDIGLSDANSLDTIRSQRGGVALDVSPYCTNPVHSKKPNRWGIYHMHGNVFEWCDDAEAGCAANKSVRGGSYCSTPADLRCSSRKFLREDLRSEAVGFRICKLAAPQTLLARLADLVRAR
jgi:formylglycine-generating enzyme required for sulfatase activity/diadenosine tetraphosphate (Ap4A) HIT family hydrolase